MSCQEQESIEFFSKKLSNTYSEEQINLLLEKLHNWMMNKVNDISMNQFIIKTNSVNQIMHIFKHKTANNLIGKISTLKIIRIFSEKEVFYTKIFEKTENNNDICNLLVQNALLKNPHVSSISSNILLNFCKFSEKFRKGLEVILRCSKNEESSNYELLIEKCKNSSFVEVISGIFGFINTIIHLNTNPNSKRLLKSEFIASGIRDVFKVNVFFFNKINT